LLALACCEGSNLSTSPWLLTVFFCGRSDLGSEKYPRGGFYSIAEALGVLAAEVPAQANGFQWLYSCISLRCFVGVSVSHALSVDERTGAAGVFSPMFLHGAIVALGNTVSNLTLGLHAALGG
jgi:hypothetical protein